MSSEEDHAALVAVLRRLRVAAKLERGARDERRRLMARAWELGATDRTVADYAGVSYNAARQRRWQMFGPIRPSDWLARNREEGSNGRLDGSGRGLPGVGSRLAG